MELSKEFVELFHKGANDPTFFVENVIGMTTLWEKQREIALSVRDNSMTAVRSCNGAGKTFTTANVVSWFLATKPNSVVISTAPTARQVRELLWQEINNIHANSKFRLGGTTTSVSWTLGAKWFALGLSTDDPNRFQGFHAKDILGVIDEGAGVEPPIWEGMDSILTSEGARLLTIGNPTEASGRFFDAFSSPLFNKIHISAFDTPNFTSCGVTFEDIKSGEWKEKVDRHGLVYPALITPKWVYERYLMWGEDSPSFKARILGQFPDVSNDTMIPLGIVLKATERPVEFSTSDMVVISVDVARFGDDDSVIGVRKGMSYVEDNVIHHMDINPLSKLVAKTADRENYDVIVVDSVGVGAGVASNLRAWGYRVVEFVAQGQAWEKDKFINRRTEAWFRVRELLRKEKVSMRYDDEMVGQITAPKYDFDGAGRYRLESKDKMKARGLKSPDRADAFIMAFDYEGDMDTHVAEDFVKSEEPEKGTVGEILAMLNQQRESEMEWATMKF